MVEMNMNLLEEKDAKEKLEEINLLFDQLESDESSKEQPSASQYLAS